MKNKSSLRDMFQEQTGFNESALTQIGLELVERSRKASDDSDHHRYHVGSSLLAINHRGKQSFYDNANMIPDPLKDQGVTSHDHIGEGSPTVHGEFPILYDAPPSEHLFLGCNTPNCASCLKSAIMRDVDALFIDSQSLPGFKGPNDKENPWTQDRADFWNDLCIPIARAAQIPIYAVNTDTGKLSILVNGKPPEERPKPEFPARILSEHEVMTMENNPDLFLSQARGRRSAIGVAHDKKTGETAYIYAEDSLPPGMSYAADGKMEEQFADAHYRLPLDPIIHMLMEASKHNLELQNGRILTNFVPSSGRQLDLAQVGLSEIFFVDKHVPPTDEARSAMQALSDYDLIEYSRVKPQKGVSKIMEANGKDHGDHYRYDVHEAQ